MSLLQRPKLPCLAWLRDYSRDTLASDLVAAAIVTIMLIPQSLAYALLAGVPAEMGLYATMLPLVTYALLGTSRTLSVGPVAVISLMTATAVGDVVATTGADYITATIALALLSGLILLAMGLLRFGFLVNFLSHPVVAGFITASAIIIALGQISHLLGVNAGGDTVLELGGSLAVALTDTNTMTLTLGLLALGLLLLARRMKSLLLDWGLAPRLADLVCKASPVLVVLLTTGLAWRFSLQDAGVALVGAVPQGLPNLRLPVLLPELWWQLADSALLIAIIGYVESVSVGKTLAAKRRQRIDPDQELIGLGAANITSALSGGIPVTGGFSRSVVNFDAGAATPAASLFAAAGMALAALLLTPLLYFLPKATLAAVIIVAVIGLVDFSHLKRAWRYSRGDFLAIATTLVVTLLAGVEMGVMCGVFASLALHLYETSRPHMAVVGEVPGTEHFRNVERHEVITHPGIVSLRVDESLYFANASYIEDAIYALVARDPQLRHVVLMCPAVNAIDLSALEVLEEVNQRLQEAGIRLHLSEVKGPVMDCLQKTDFVSRLSGEVFLSQHQAIAELSNCQPPRSKMLLSAF
ncbi:MAG: sulfate permease [Halieaceae bacterium]|jgi:SulP family sulfate permease|nr:sulfate permease [Halieaceae bacterium]